MATQFLYMDLSDKHDKRRGTTADSKTVTIVTVITRTLPAVATHVGVTGPGAKSVMRHLTASLLEFIAPLNV